jgi:hypothetical protein
MPLSGTGTTYTSRAPALGDTGLPGEKGQVGAKGQTGDMGIQGQKGK